MSVYFITCREVGAVKIGHSVDPIGRLPEIQMGCPLKLTLEATMPGRREEEAAMHWRFSEHRIHGEWFRLCEDIDRIIVANPAPASRQCGPKGGKPVRVITPIKDERVRKQPMSPLARYDLKIAKREMTKRIAAGDIHFPFRARESA